jgi:hypothetical protein
MWMVWLLAAVDPTVFLPLAVLDVVTRPKATCAQSMRGYKGGAFRHVQVLELLASF